MDFPQKPDAPDNVPKVPLRGSGCRCNVLLAAFSSLLFIVALGMVSAYAAPASVDMQRPGSRFINITSSQITWLASIQLLTGMVGNALSGYLSHRFGRKAVLMLASLPYSLGWLAITYAGDLTTVYLGRLLTGFCSGICSVAASAYVVEISTVEIRGLLSSSFHVAYSSGVLACMVLGATLRWSWLAVAGAVIVVCGSALMCSMPESPLWLMRTSRKAEAIRGLIFLRGNRDVAAKELREIMKHEPEGRLALKELLEPTLYKPLLIAIGLMFFQQFSGMNALMSYSVELFQNNKSSVDASLVSIIVAAVQLVATSFTSILVDRAGRRVLFISSGIIMLLGLVTSGVYIQLSSGYTIQELGAWSLVPVLSFVTYTAAFAFGYGPIPFVVNPEMVPTHSRSFLIAVGSVSCSLFGFIVTKTFDDLRNLVGMPGVYYTYAVFTLLGFLFYWIFIPETKGRTIRDIHRSFSINEQQSP